MYGQAHKMMLPISMQATECDALSINAVCVVLAFEFANSDDDCAWRKLTSQNSHDSNYAPYQTEYTQSNILYDKA